MEYSILHRHLMFSFVYWYNRQVLLLMICVYVWYVRPTLPYSRVVYMDQPRQAAKPARGQLNREISVLADASVVRTYVLLFAFVYIPDIFLFGYTYIRARFTAVYAYMYDYSGVGTHYVLRKPPKRFDIFPLTGGCSEGLDAFRFILLKVHICTYYAP